MKSNFLKIACVVIVAFGMLACDSEEVLDKKLNFSKLSVEEQKQKIEESGIEFLETLEKVKTTQAFITIEDFVTENEIFKVPQMQMIKSAMESNDVKVLGNLDRQMRMIAEDDGFWGEHVWNYTKGDFDKVASFTNKAIFRFPASKTDKANGAVLTLNYTESKVVIPDTYEYYPSSASCILKVNGVQAFKADFSGEYKSDGTPTKANHSMEVGDFKWTMALKNTTKEFTEEYEFKHKTKTLVKSSATIKGNLTVDNMEDVDDPSDVITYASMYFQIMDIALMGGVKDVKAFVNELNAIQYADSQTNRQKECDAFNKHMILYGYFVKDEKKFAEVEFYVYEDTYTEFYYYWNGSYYESLLSGKTGINFYCDVNGAFAAHFL